MFKKTITYTDYNGEEITDDFYFNLTKAELLEMQLGVHGGLSKLLEKIVKEKDQPKLTSYFKEIILKAYGEKSADGKRFIKSEELSTAFTQTDAYSKLFVELALNADAATEFINGVMPVDL